MTKKELELKIELLEEKIKSLTIRLEKVEGDKKDYTPLNNYPILPGDYPNIVETTNYFNNTLDTAE